MEKILITGGAGFIGSHLADALIERSNEVVIIDNLSTGNKENLNPKAVFYCEDLANFEKIEEIFKKEAPQIVYHLAAQIDIRKSVENPTSDAKTNIINSLNLLDLSVKYPVKHFIFSSTGGAIYGDTENIPTDEAHKEAPISPYACAKLAVEKYLNFYNKVYGLKYTCLRYSNVYGPRQNPYGEAGVVAVFLNKLFKNESPTIFGGIQTRDFVFVKDVVNANLLALNDTNSEVYNVSTKTETDIIRIFELLNSYFRSKFKPEYQEMKKGEQKRSCLGYEKIKSSLGWNPSTSLSEGLNQTYCWFLKNRRTYIQK